MMLNKMLSEEAEMEPTAEGGRVIITITNSTLPVPPSSEDQALVKHGYKNREQAERPCW